MKSIHLTILFIFILTATIFAQLQTPGTLPTDSLKGHWQFNDAANLNLATVGTDLVQEHVSGDTIKITAIDGPNGSGAVNIASGSFLRAPHNSGVTGSDTLTNQYTIVMDARYSNLSYYRVFYNSSSDAADDGDIFSNTSGGIGGGSSIGGYSSYGVTDGGWFRVTFVADLGNSYKIYLDGQLINEASQGFEIDGRMALNPVEFLLSHDNDGEDNEIDIAELAVYNRVLTEQEIIDIGGYAHYALATEQVGLWDMNKADSLWFATSGEDISVSGSQTALNDTIRLGYKNLAASLDGGASYSINHGLQVVPEGFAGHGTKVNYYTLVMDVRLPVLGASYELVNNGGTAALMINEQGQIGSSSLGWSDLNMNANEWYKIAVSVSLDNPNATDVTIYADGLPVFSKDELAADGEMGFDLAGVQLYTDGNQIDVSNIMLYSTGLTDKGVADLGGYTHLELATDGLEIRAQQDAYVRGGTNSDNNYNTYRLLLRKTTTDNPSYARNSYISFDLSSVTEPITSARLRLVTRFVGGSSGRNTLAFHKVSDDTWLDSTITWNTAPAFGDLLFEDLVVPRQRKKELEPFNVFEYDVTAYVQDEINIGDFLVSFAATPTEADTDIRFYSLEGDTQYLNLKEWQKPTLVINGLITDVEVGTTIPGKFELNQNYPNPFNPTTNIKYSLAKTSNVKLTIFNILGQKMATLIENVKQSAGSHNVKFNAQNFTSGIYFYRLEASDFVDVRKMMLIK